MEVDTGTNESAHKTEKPAAKLTQKAKERFDEQTATRLEEVHLLDLAEQEIWGNNIWDYHNYHRPGENSPISFADAHHGGQKYYVEHSQEENKFVAKLVTRKRGNQNIFLEQSLLDFIGGLQVIMSKQNVRFCQPSPWWPYFPGKY